MKTIKSFCTMMSVLALVAVSCEPENKGRGDEPDVPVVNETKTISSIRYVDCVYGSESMTDFVYDGQGRVISIETDDGYGSYAVDVVYSGNEVTVTSKGVKTKCDFWESSDMWYNSLSKRTLTTLEDKKRLKTKCA